MTKLEEEIEVAMRHGIDPDNIVFNWQESIKAVKSLFKREMEKVLNEVIEANKDKTLGTYDYDGIARDVIEQRKRLEEVLK